MYRVVHRTPPELGKITLVTITWMPMLKGVPGRDINQAILKVLTQITIIKTIVGRLSVRAGPHGMKRTRKLSTIIIRMFQQTL